MEEICCAWLIYAASEQSEGSYYWETNMYSVVKLVTRYWKHQIPILPFSWSRGRKQTKHNPFLSKRQDGENAIHLTSVFKEKDEVGRRSSILPKDEDRPY